MKRIGKSIMCDHLDPDDLVQFYPLNREEAVAIVAAAGSVLDTHHRRTLIIMAGQLVDYGFAPARVIEAVAAVVAVLEGGGDDQ